MLGLAYVYPSYLTAVAQIANANNNHLIIFEVFGHWTTTVLKNGKKTQTDLYVYENEKTSTNRSI